MTPEATAPRTREISLGAIAWVAAAALFIGLRAAAAANLPVSGAELVHLTGAWQARLGVDDARFVPTLFQSLSAVLLFGSSSENASRLLALMATATTPLALWYLRPRLGDAGALLALLFLALDAPAILLGTTASALAFDYAAALWLLVLLLRAASLRWAWAAVGFVVATGGPLLLPLVAAYVVTLPRGRFAAPGRIALDSQAAVAWASAPAILFAGGAALGVAGASSRFGLGWHGLVVPPFDLLSESFGGKWLTLTNGDALLLYVLPLVVLGAAAWLAALAPAVRSLMAAPSPPAPGESDLDGEPAPTPRFETPPVLLAWALFAAAWLIVAISAHSTVALTALTMPLCLLLGPATVRACSAMAAASWRLARVLLPAAALGASIGLYYLVKWAAVEQVGGDRDQFIAAVAGLVALACLVYLAWAARETATLSAAALAVGLPLFAAGAFNVALGPAGEPLVSPYSPGQAGELRDAALAAAGGPGAIAIHPSLEGEFAWPFRNSGDILIASRIPETARVVIWPADVAFPADATRFLGDWALTRRVFPPTGGLLRYLHWYIDRNRLTVTPAGIAVYTRTTP